MGIGILGADMLSTVSPTYAREILGAEGGYGLDGVLRLRQDRLSGILNGIDTDSWNPSTDPELIRNFDASTLPRRAQNKAALQDEAGLEKDARMPLLGVVSRLVKEKGFDIAAPAVQALARPRRPVRPARHGRPDASSTSSRSSRCAIPTARASGSASTRATPGASTPAPTPF